MISLGVKNLYIDHNVSCIFVMTLLCFIHNNTLCFIFKAENLPVKELMFWGPIKQKLSQRGNSNNLCLVRFHNHVAYWWLRGGECDIVYLWCARHGGIGVRWHLYYCTQLCTAERRGRIFRTFRVIDFFKSSLRKTRLETGIILRSFCMINFFTMSSIFCKSCYHTNKFSRRCILMSS